MVLYKSLSQYILFYLFPHDQFSVLHTFIALSMVQVFLIQNNSTCCTLTGLQSSIDRDCPSVPACPVLDSDDQWQLVSVLESGGTVADHCSPFSTPPSHNNQSVETQADDGKTLPTVISWVEAVEGAHVGISIKIKSFRFIIIICCEFIHQ